MEVWRRVIVAVVSIPAAGCAVVVGVRVGEEEALHVVVEVAHPVVLLGEAVRQAVAAGTSSKD